MASLSISELTGHVSDIRQLKPDDIFVLPSGKIGLELEFEDFGVFSLGPGDLSLWTITEDGSLRGENAVELVFKEPYFGKDIIAALDQLEVAVSKLGYTPYCSSRTSLHVHLDMRDSTVDTLLKILVFYTITEHLLYNYAGSDRRNNIFCLPLFKAEGNITTLSNISLVRNKTGFKQLMRGVARYAGLNLASIQKFGSLEFRLHKGEWEKSRIIKWINILMCLKHAAEKFTGGYADIITFVQEKGPEHVVNYIFNEYAPDLLYEGYEEDMLYNLEIGKDICFYPMYKKSAMFDLPYTYKRTNDEELFAKFVEKRNLNKLKPANREFTMDLIEPFAGDF